jgi:hypothetical protein
MFGGSKPLAIFPREMDTAGRSLGDGTPVVFRRESIRFTAYVC